MPLFDSLSNTQRSLIASSLEPVSFDGGDVIFEEGDHGDYFFIVEAGGVKVIKQRATTGEIVLTEIGAGGYFGELALLSRSPRSASCVAAPDGAQLLRISRVGFDRALGPMVKIIRQGMTQQSQTQNPQSLIAACMYGSAESVEHFLAEERPSMGAAAVVDKQKRLTLLHAACALGHHDVARYLLKNGAQIDGATKAGATALHIAAREGHLQVVQLLCSSNALVKSKTSGGASPMYLAAQGGHVKVMKVLIKHRANPTEACGKSKSTPLHVAAERGHFDVVSFLLSETRTAVDQKDGDGATALHYAAAYGNTACVWRLLERGASANSTLPNGATAFFLAAQNGHDAVLRLLLDLPGIDPHAKATDASGTVVRTASSRLALPARRCLPPEWFAHPVGALRCLPLRLRTMEATRPWLIRSGSCWTQASPQVRLPPLLQGYILRSRC